MPRRLNLRKERLAELTTDDLHRVAGAAPDAIGLESAIKTCMTFRACTTAPTCGCEPTWPCD